MFAGWWLPQHSHPRTGFAVCHCRSLAQPTGSLKVIVITDVKVHIESLSVAVSIGSEDIFVEGPIYTDGWRRGEDWKRLDAAKATHSSPLRCPVAQGLSPGLCHVPSPLAMVEVNQPFGSLRPPMP